MAFQEIGETGIKIPATTPSGDAGKILSDNFTAIAEAITATPAYADRAGEADEAVQLAQGEYYLSFNPLDGSIGNGTWSINDDGTTSGIVASASAPDSLQNGTYVLNLSSSGVVSDTAPEVSGHYFLGVDAYDRVFLKTIDDTEAAYPLMLGTWTLSGAAATPKGGMIQLYPDTDNNYAGNVYIDTGQASEAAIILRADVDGTATEMLRVDAEGLHYTDTSPLVAGFDYAGSVYNEQEYVLTGVTVDRHSDYADDVFNVPEAGTYQFTACSYFQNMTTDNYMLLQVRKNGSPLVTIYKGILSPLDDAGVSGVAVAELSQGDTIDIIIYQSNANEDVLTEYSNWSVKKL